MQPAGWLAIFADCHVETIGDQEDEDTIKAMFTRNGGEAIDR